jgi:hypothetical protein
LLASRTDSNASQLKSYMPLEIFTQANGVNFGRSKISSHQSNPFSPIWQEDLIIWCSKKSFEVRTSHKQTYLVGDVSNCFIDWFRVPGPEQFYGAKELKKGLLDLYRGRSDRSPLFLKRVIDLN